MEDNHIKKELEDMKKILIEIRDILKIICNQIPPMSWNNDR